MTSPSERLAKINEAIKYVRNIPQNKWDYGKYREMYENNVKEALKRLNDHKVRVSECRLRGMDESEIHRSFSNEHIQLLEAVIAAKKTLAMMDAGTVEELTRQKIAILEEMASS
jgi:tRNA U54 and U55 pseudouridine synthase Pus10